MLSSYHFTSGPAPEPEPELKFAGLTVLFSAPKEALGFRDALVAARKACTSLQIIREIGDWEILIVDEGSREDLRRIADACVQQDNRARIVRPAIGSGPGVAVRSGLRQARHELILFSDADRPFDTEEIAKACRLMRIYDAEVVSAFRHDCTAEGALRVFFGWTYDRTVRVIFGLRIRDASFPFKLFRRRILDKIRLSSEGDFVGVEVLARAKDLGYRIIQFGVDHFSRRPAAVPSSFGAIRVVLRDLVSCAIDIRWRRRTSPNEHSFGVQGE